MKYPESMICKISEVRKSERERETWRKMKWKNERRGTRKVEINRERTLAHSAQNGEFISCMQSKLFYIFFSVYILFGVRFFVARYTVCAHLHACYGNTADRLHIQSYRITIPTFVQKDCFFAAKRSTTNSTMTKNVHYINV